MKKEFMTVPHFLGDGKISTKEQEIPKPEDNQHLIQAKSNWIFDNFNDALDVIHGLFDDYVNHV